MSEHAGVISDADVIAGVRAALKVVDDPEYPGISIVDLGLVERVEADGGVVRVGLIPTFSGCPALGIIADDVQAQVGAVPGVECVDVTWLRAPAWTVERVSAAARSALADSFTVAVKIGRSEPACPRCGAVTAPQSMFGPSRCRSVSTCLSCHETVEVLRA